MNRTLQNFHAKGFSILELVGVLAIMAVLASVLVPPMIEQINLAVVERENSDLTSLAEGLRSSIKRNGYIPDENDWVDEVSEELGWSAYEVLFNIRKMPRVFLIDPDLRIGPSATDTLPYSQTNSGSQLPVSPRLLIVSSIDPSRALPVVSGIADTDEFEEIWSLAEGAVPTGWTGTWSSGGDQLKIERIHLGDLFHPMVLNSNETPRGFFACNENSSTVAPLGTAKIYLIEGTEVALYDVSNELESSNVLDAPASFSFEDGSWHSRVFLGGVSDTYEVNLAKTLFAELPTAGVSSTSDVAESLTLFFSSYANWNAPETIDEEDPAYLLMLQRQAELENIVADLIPSP